MFAIDSSIWVAYFEGKVSDDIKSIIESQTLLTASIGVVEIAAKFEKIGEDGTKQLAFLIGRSLVVPLDAPLSIIAGRQYIKLRKKKPKLSMADAIHLTTAQQYGAPLITCDRDFIQIDGVKFVNMQKA